MLRQKFIITGTLLVLLLAITIPSGCKEGPDNSTPESNRWLELLQVLPENEETLKGVYLQDFASIKEKLKQYPGITEQYGISHFSVGSRSSLLSRYNWDTAITEEYERTVGFTLEAIGQIITSGENPWVYEAYRGTFSKVSIDNAVKTGPLNDQLEIVQYDNYTFYSWGEDNLANLEQRSSVRPLGRGHRLALAGDFVFWMTWTEGIEDMLDSYSNKKESLADVEEFRLLAEGIEALDVTHAYFSTDTSSYAEMKEWLELSKDKFPIDPDEQQRIEESIEHAPLLKPYQAFTTGCGLDKDGYYLTIVLLNTDKDTADKNASLLKQRIKETKNIRQDGIWMDWIDDIDIESKGRLTSAKLYGPVCEFWMNRFSIQSAGTSYEPLLLHE